MGHLTLGYYWLGSGFLAAYSTFFVAPRGRRIHTIVTCFFKEPLSFEGPGENFGSAIAQRAALAHPPGRITVGDVMLVAVFFVLCTGLGFLTAITVLISLMVRLGGILLSGRAEE